MPNGSPSRRDEYAEATRQEVVKAARRLFADQGYAQTTVAQIAKEARVSPATIYAQCGGKEGLLQTLMDMWTTSPTVGRIITDAVAADTGRTMLEVLAAGYAAHAAEAGDIMRIVERAAPSSPPPRPSSTSPTSATSSHSKPSSRASPLTTNLLRTSAPKTPPASSTSTFTTRSSC